MLATKIENLNVPWGQAAISLAIMQKIRVNNVAIVKNALSRDCQTCLVAQAREIAKVAPFFSPTLPNGTPMSVRMTSAGEVGWISDARGYRYAARHPTGVFWPKIPHDILAIWDKFSGCFTAPDTCLVNFYAEAARMGLHQDKDERDLDFPVLSISLGDSARFRVGGKNRCDPTQSIWLHSGDIAVLDGPSRQAFHGVDQMRFKSSSLLPKGGRINLTLRVALQSRA